MIYNFSITLGYWANKAGLFYNKAGLFYNNAALLLDKGREAKLTGCGQADKKT